MAADLFPDLDAERARLAFARRSRDLMIERLTAVDPNGAADEITKEYIEVTVADALEDLRGPGAGDFFGRIDEWYIGRRHIEDDRHEPVVVDWRAPIAAPFYRATSVDPLGVAFRRRFTLDDGDLIAYLDEHLDDPDEGEVAGGIPDPVLAEIGAERSGEMREIVSTIQAEQDVVIRSPIDQVLVVQGGPGTGKTAVALHRAAYLLFEHRARLARDGVLVVGPNQAFLDYIANVLPSLGERTVRQATVDELCIPRVDVTGVDDVESARWKGAAERLADLDALALAAITPPDDDIRIPIGSRTHVIERDLFADWLATAVSGTSPLNQRRERMRSLAQRELLARTGSDDAWRQAAPLKAAISKAWPTQKPERLVDKLLPGPSGKRRVWTRADQLLIDEANSMLNGSPFTYGHVIVDEAQDHSAVALRVIGRRSPSGSMTLVGDVAQSTTPAGQERWSSVFEHLSVRGRSVGTIADLTIGYRVPEPILLVANRLLEHTGVDAIESRSVRRAGEPPTWHRVAPRPRAAERHDLAERVAEVAAATKRRRRVSGIVAPLRLHASIARTLVDRGLIAVDHVHELGPDEIPVFDPERVKGLEFDGVIVVNPHEILSEGAQLAITPRGARLLYVAMTRAVQELHLVTDAAPPVVLDGPRTAARSGYTSKIQVVAEPVIPQSPSDWDPEQYRRFASERAQPFHDLLDRLGRVPVGRAVDLGCGPGELTALAADRLAVGSMTGIDSSPAMLASAQTHASDRVVFEAGDIAEWTSDGEHDLVLAAASLQWVPDHRSVLARWVAALAPGGRLAVQVPANAHAPTHVVAARVAEREPHRSVFGASGPPTDPVADNVLAPDEYARILYDLGCVDIEVDLHVYPHVLPSTRHAVEWVKGTTLTRFRSAMPTDAYDAFLVDYERELVAEMGDHEPCFFPFDRILFTATRPQ